MIILVYIIVFVKFIYPAMERYMGLPELPSLFLEMIIFSMFAITFIIKGFSDISLKLIQGYFRYIILFVTVIIVSAIINSDPLMLLLKSMIEYNLYYIFLFLVIINSDATERQQVLLIKLLYFLLFLQIPVAIFQYLFEGSASADSISGTLSSSNAGGTGTSAVLASILLSIIIAWIMVSGINLKRIVLLLLTFIPPLVGGARFGFILIPVALFAAILSSLYLTGKMKVRQIIYFSLLALFLTAGITIVFEEVAPASKYSGHIGSLKMITDPDAMLAYDSGTKEGRFSKFIDMLEKQTEDLPGLFLGKGSAAVTSSSTLAVRGVQIENLRGSTDLLKIFTSLGLCGLILIVGMLISSIGAIKRYIMNETSVFIVVNGFAFISIPLLLILSLGYTSVWTSQIGLVFWVLFGVFMRRYLVFAGAEEIIKKIKNPITQFN